MAELTKEKFRPVDRSRFDSDAIVRPTVTYWQDAWRRLRKNPIAVFSMILLLACVLFITLGPTISGEEYVSINAVMKNKPADGTHWFGTDILGRDLFSRVCVGARASLIVAIACTFIQIVVGCAYGGIMAYFGGWLDEVMMRIVEILTSIPSLLLTLLMADNTTCISSASIFKCLTDSIAFSVYLLFFVLTDFVCNNRSTSSAL